MAKNKYKKNSFTLLDALMIILVICSIATIIYMGYNEYKNQESNTPEQTENKYIFE